MTAVITSRALDIPGASSQPARNQVATPAPAVLYVLRDPVLNVLRLDTTSAGTTSTAHHLHRAVMSQDIRMTPNLRDLCGRRVLK